MEAAETCLRIGHEIECDDTLDGRWRLSLNGRALDELPRGRHPVVNSALALAAADAIQTVDAGIARRAIEAAWMPGRCEEIERGGRRWVVDVAHNPLGAAWLRGELPRRYPGARVIAVFGTLADKDAGGVLAALGDIVAQWILADAPPPRGLAATALAERLGMPGHLAVGTVAQGMAAAGSLARPGDVILVFGSFATAEAARLELTKSGDTLARAEWPSS